MKYVAGFMFNLARTEVALIRKTKPEWQKGFLNGIGGKIEEGECEIDAMCREFEEETGLKTYYYDWKHLIDLKSKKDWTVSFYYCHQLTNDFAGIKTTTEEDVVIIKVSDLETENVIPNLRWLIRMCLDDEILGGEILNK